MENRVIKVLVIEDDPNYFALLNERMSLIRNPSFELIRSKLLQSGLQRLAQKDIDIVLLDLMLPDCGGLLTFQEVHKNFPEVPIIILTSLDNDELAAKSIALGAQDYLPKGTFDRELLIKSMCYAISRNKVQSELQKYYLENEASKKNLLEKDERLRSLVTNIPGVVYRYTLTEQGWYIEFLNDMIQTISGIPAEVLMGKDIAKYFELIVPQDLPIVKDAFDNAVSQATSFSIDYRIVNRNGQFRCLHDQGKGVAGPNGKVIHIDGVIFDVTERAEAKAKLDQLVTQDPLTNLPNREVFIALLDQAILQARRNKENGAVLVIDLDHFKRINDIKGHAVGDQLIKAVAIRLGKTLYDSDTITRISGGTFMALLSKVKKNEDMENAANKILTSFKSPFVINNDELFTTCSIGIALFPQDGDKAADLMKNADAAMHRAKESGKDCYQFYSCALSTASEERLIIENHLRRALERNEFRLFYQPQLDLRSGQTVAVEALLRWQHPNLGFIPPMEFIPIAEETGLIHPIGEWVLKEACEQKKIWNQQGFKSLRVAVNLSARQFHYANLVELVTNVIKNVDLDPRDLDLELTESTLMEHLKETSEILGKLKTMGAHISIDDFGTGYSSLMYLKTFPIHAIKIDKSFVKGITSDSDDRAITQAIISMAHSLKLEVVAEGVENYEQLELLKSQGCDVIQGFLYSKPVSAVDITALLTNGVHSKTPSGGAG